MGGRQVRTQPIYGNAFDHFAVDYEYPKGVHMMSMCRQIDGTDGNITEAVAGTKGCYDLQAGTYVYRPHDGKVERTRSRDIRERNPYEQEHIDMIESIRSGHPLNELKTVAESTLTAIMGRMSAYTGKVVTWDQALNSKLELMPKDLKFGPIPTPPVAIPGETPLV